MIDRSLEQATQFWDRAAEDYEEAFSGRLIGQTRREAVWRDLERLFHSGDHVLEISCGTGLDAVFLASRGVTLVACDLSPRMIESARRHAVEQKVEDRIEFVVLPTEELGRLGPAPLFSGAFSDFAGLNFIEDLVPVREDLAKLLRPGATLYFSMMGRFVPSEILWFLLHGRPRRAFSRLQREDVNVGAAQQLNIYRPSVKTILAKFEPAFRLRRRRGIGITVPPSYAEAVAQRFPRMIRAMARLDLLLGGLPVFRDMADCMIFEFERVEDR